MPTQKFLYQHCQTCETSEYSKLNETMAPEVLNRIIYFIQTITEKPNS